MSDVRLTAMAKEMCRMIGRDPDEVIWATRGKQPRYLGYMENMRRLLQAADEAAASERTSRPRKNLAKDTP